MVLGTFTLRDGRTLVLRHVEPSDKLRLAAAHARLSEETIRRRYLASKPKLTRADLRYLTEVNRRDHIAVVVVTAEAPQRIVAVARCIRLPERPEVAEWAIVVTDELQGMGVGGHLARTLASEAAKVGLRSFTATTFGENQPIQRLMGSITRDLHGDWAGNGVRELAGDLRAA